MSKLDLHPDVLWWQSEENVIPYRDPVSGRIRRYFPDFLCCVVDGTGKKTVQLIEVKPDVQTRPPKKGSRQTKRYVEEAYTFAKNQAKWDAAQRWCDDRGYAFKVMNEFDIGISKRKKSAQL